MKFKCGWCRCKTCVHNPISGNDYTGCTECYECEDKCGKMHDVIACSDYQHWEDENENNKDS